MRDNLTIVYADTTSQAVDARRTLGLPGNDVICIGRRATGSALRGFESARSGRVLLIGNVTLKDAHRQCIQILIPQAVMFRITPMGYVR